VTLQDRYEVRPLADKYGIRDMAMGRMCKLEGRLLVWPDRKDAVEWLTFCYQTWGVNPARHEEPPPRKQWGARRYNPRHVGSPWEGYTTPVDPSEIPFRR
jgi:hypothetical protein